ncbi:MAG TPA: four helix bundle protein [Verrucomicrobiae bacterium]|nr:four helix bundle protein [Verrucomicrobiae bacterium]
MSKISEERNSEPTGGARLVASHKDLLVWQRSMDLVETVYRLTGSFPATEQWGLISQMRRAAISVPSNIAEGYGRQATGEYRHHVSFARGSLLELETQILLARRLKYLQAVDAEPVLKEIDQISRMLATSVSKLS